MKFLLLSVAIIVLSGCTQPDVAHRVLSSAGYTNIEMRGYSWFSCSKDDTYNDSFVAVGPSGQQVSGTVCAGLLFKNSTIRFD